jgi:TolB-like protein/DNA-binding winged helix-turn-helix (wHTH) protein
MHPQQEGQKVDLERPAQHAPSYSFLDFTLDLRTERLVRGTTEVRLRLKSFQVLRVLVEHHGRLVTREELMQSVWGDIAVTDESITKCVGDIRKALADNSQEILRTVPRRGFVFEPEVRAIDTPPSRDHQAAASWRQAVRLTGLAVVGLAAILVSIRWRGDLFGRRPVFEAIAVLPFESLTNADDQQYLADGMTEALITNLGQASPLRVIARTSVNQYQKTKKPIQQIARELKVDVIVEGAIAQSGDRIRVTANLIQVSPEKHIWAHAYERNLRGALALQNEIAGTIAEEIAGKLSPRPQSRLANSRLVNPEAQAAYWKAKYLLDHRFRVGLEKDYRKIIDYSEQAIRMDPDYAPAHATLSRAYATISDIGQAFPRDIMPHARAEAQRAVALDEGLGYGHVALGYVLLIYDRDWAGTEREATRAISLNPSDADAHELLASYLAAVGRVDEAVIEMKRARELDPFSFDVNWDLGRMLCFARRYDEALAELRQAGDMERNSPAVDIWTFKSYWAKGQANEAVAVDMRLRSYRDRLNVDILREAYSSKGSRGYWTKVRELVLPQFRTNPIGWYRLGEINTYLGDKEEAFRWLEKAYEERPNWIPWIKVDPSLDSLRSDPRFTALLRRMGLTP